MYRNRPLGVSSVARQRRRALFKELVMKTSTILKAVAFSFALASPAIATTHGSVEPIATPEVIAGPCWSVFR